MSPAWAVTEGAGAVVRPTGAVNSLLLVATVVAASLGYTVALSVAPHLPRALPALPVFYSFAIAGCLVATYLLAVRARTRGDEAVGWMACGYGIAAVAMALQILGYPSISPAGGPLRTTSSGTAALYLLWHAVVPVCALLGVLHRHLPGWIRPAVVTSALTLVGYVSYGPAPLPEYFTSDARYTANLVTSIAALTVLSLVATIAWARSAGRRPAWTVAWVTVSLALSTWDLALHSLAEERFTVFWWASLSMRLAQFLVLAAGLLAGFVGLFRALERHSTSLSDRLDREAQRARREHEERLVFHAAVDEATDRVRAVLDDPTQLTMVFQPVVDLRTDRVVGVEALARFSAEPVRPPDVWFDEAARLGLGVDLELAAVTAATAAIAEIPNDVYLAVNLSPEAVVSPRLHACLTGVPLDRLVLEITEHAQVDDYDGLSLALERLRAHGCRIAVDDAGAGYATFRHILRLAPHLIKLDTSLTMGIERDPVRLALARSLIDFANESGASIVAEGMESPAQIDVLRGLGATSAQGYHLGRPSSLAHALGARVGVT